MYSESIMQRIRQGMDLEENNASRDKEILKMSPATVFEKALDWEGIIGFGGMIRDFIEEIYDIDLNSFTVNEMKFNQFKNKMLESKSEGIVLLGAGGSLDQWIDGLTSALCEEGVTVSRNVKHNFSEFIKLTTSGGRIDLVMVFKEKADIDLGKLAMWRLHYGNCSWISDYIVNYANQHNFAD